MKKIFIIILTIFLVFGCSKGANSDFELEGDRTGLPINLKFEEGLKTFTPSTTLKDFLGEEFSIDENGLLTLPLNSDGDGYKLVETPAVFSASLTERAKKSKVETYNIGGFEYSAWIRLTDSTKTELDGVTPVNEPQAGVLSVIWVDANQNPIGSLLVLCFIKEPFPKIPELDENIILVMNYHDPSIAHLIACCIHDITAASGMDYTNNSEKDLLTNLADNGFFKVTLRIDDDVNEVTTNPETNEEKLTPISGPTLSVLINDVEVIKYQNNGSTHSVGPGAWDSWKLKFGTYYAIARDVLKISEENDRVPLFRVKDGKHIGSKEYVQAWKNIVENAALTTFGFASQLGKTGDNRNFNLAPQVGQIEIKKYSSKSE